MISAGLPSDRVITIILGGGRGTRLYPLTKRRAKPAVPIGGKYRLIDIPLSNSINSGYRLIYLLTQYASDSLIRHIQETFRFGPFVSGHVQILAAQQTLTSSDWYQGTADAVRQNMGRFKSKQGDYYLILSGDHLYRMDYRELLAFHKEGKRDVTVACTPVSRKKAGEFGILKLDSDCRITEFSEKPKTREAVDRLVMDQEVRRRFDFKDPEKCVAGSMGVYIFNPAVMEEYMAAHEGMDDFGRDIIPHAIKNFNVGGYLFKGYWEDIGTIRSYYEAGISIAETNAFAFNYPGFSTYTHRRYLSATKIEDARIRSSLISDGVYIGFGSWISRSIVGLRSVIGDHTEISDSIIMGNDYYESGTAEGDEIPLGIGAGTKLKGVIVDKNVRSGENCSLIAKKGCSDQENNLFVIRDGVIAVPKDTTVPSGTRI